MIKSNELRIGNVFYFPFHKQNISIIGYGKVVYHETYMAQFETNGGIIFEPLTVLKPIPLTEEILIKLGFVQNPDKWFEINYFTDCKESAEKMAISINLVSNRCAIFDTDTEQNQAMTAKRIYYLHQLQNLYWCLVEQELNISELI